MHREYYSRVAVVSVCVLAVAVAVGAIALLPADIRARGADKIAVQAATAAKKNNDLSNLDRAEKDLGRGNDLLAALGAGTDEARFSGVVRSIVSIYSPILVSSFNISRDGSSTIDVVLQGIAPTRDDLLAFKSRLEALTPGASTELPIATLAKNVNVPFTIRLTEHLK